jgi:hypothetical protein
MNETKRRRVWPGVWLVVVLTVALATVALSIFSKPKLHQGKSVRQWVSLLDMHVDHKKQREEASWALVQIGAPALPELERILAWRPIWETVRNYAVRFRLAKPLPIHPLELQSRACEAAYNLAERANADISGLVPHLQYHFTNGTYADSNSGRALAAAGPIGISVLTNLLSAGGRSVRDNAGSALAHVDTRPEVIEALIRSANSDPNPRLRANAVFYLKGSRAPAHQMALLGLKFLQSDDRYDRWAAAMLLHDYRAIPEVRTALEAAISDPDDRVRSVIQLALKEEDERSRR